MPQLVNGMKFKNKIQKRCITCIEDKSKRIINKFPDIKATKPLEFIHTDIYECKINESINNIRYIIVFVDDFTGFLKVYPMLHKDEAPDMFIKYINFSSRYGHIKSMRSDQALEYCSEKLQA